MMGPNGTPCGPYERSAPKLKPTVPHSPMSTPSRLLEQNRAWSDRVQSRSPELFDDLAKGQSPDVLWIGCADSRVPPDRIVDCDPGQLFVHRNVANLVVDTDLNGMAVVQFAVHVLEVSHVVVCGHYGCGGVKAALSNDSTGVLGHWLEPLSALCRHHASELEDLDEGERWDRCCELNVEVQVQNLAYAPPVRHAWEDGRDFAIHGWIYELDTGRIQDLDVSVNATSFA